MSDYKNGARRRVFSASYGAPSGGLNTRDSPMLRGPNFADTLINFIASPNGVAARQGYKEYATGLTGLVETIMPYNAGVGKNKLFAVHGVENNYKFADITNPGAAILTGISTQSGLKSTRWSHTNYGTAAGQYLIACNGVDPARHWNGDEWTVWQNVPSGEANLPGKINGIEPSKFASVISHQQRLWFVEENSTRAWYLGVGLLGGAAKSFDFGQLFQRGGKLVALASWTMNGGDGMQNMLVAISSTGDTVIYEGTDVATAGNFTLQGTWRLGAPVGPNCFLQFGGDTLLLSYDGLVPLSKFMQTTTTSPALSDTIRQTITALLNELGSLPGFQLQDYLQQNLLILNVPQINPMRNFQLVFNTITGGWSVFQGWPAQCFAQQNDLILFGALGKVYQAFVGYRDAAALDGTGGEYYIASAQQSQNNFEKPGRRKRFVRGKVNIQSAAQTPDIKIACNVDYDMTPPDDTGTPATVVGSVWDSGRWDQSSWGSNTLTNYNQWITLGKIGYTGAIVLAISVKAETLWISTDWEIELGSS